MTCYTPIESFYTEDADGNLLTWITATFSFEGYEETQTYCFEGKLSKEESELKLEETLKVLASISEEKKSEEVKNDAGLTLDLEVEVDTKE